MNGDQAPALHIAQQIPGGGAPRWSGSGYMVRCPGHDDHDPSLHISCRGGKILFFCHGHCSQNQVWHAFPQAVRDQIAPRSSRNGNSGPTGPMPAAVSGTEIMTPCALLESEITPALDPARQHVPQNCTRTHIYPYHRPDGRIAGYKIRYQTPHGKSFQQMSYWIDPGTGKPVLRFKGMKAPQPLYRAHEIHRNPHAEILFTEGEKAAEAAAKLFENCIGTTANSPGRSYRNLRPGNEDLSILRGRAIHLMADHDDTGRRTMEAWEMLFEQEGLHVKSRTDSAHLCRDILGPAQFPKGYDLADALAGGLTAHAISRHRAGLPEHHPLHKRDP